MTGHSSKSDRQRIGAYVSWVRTTNRTVRTAPARAAAGRALNVRLLAEIDSDGALPERERALRLEDARKAYFAWLAQRSAEVRRGTMRLRDGDARP